jgi:anti-sigma B factor antagonist
MDESKPLPSPAQPPDSAQPFTCELRSEGRGAAWVTPRGQLDVAGAPQLRRVLQGALDDALLVIIDLRELSFIDSTGMLVLFEADDYARQMGRRLVILRNAEVAARLSALTETDTQLRVLDLG